MTHSIALKFVAACALQACTAGALAHITLPPGGAVAGSDYEAAFRVGHACKDAKATTGVTVRLPKGFALGDVPARPGWKIEVQKAGDGEVRWSADGFANALPAKERTEFIVRGKLTATPGPLYFKVLQSCDTGSADWAQLPTGAAGEKLDFPAARLDVLPPGVAAVDVGDAWVRATVPGQSGTGAFMKLSAPSGARLVGVSTPAAGVAEVHEMKMEGSTMKMRAAPALELPPRQTVELKPGGYHVMLMDLKQPLVNGTSLPLVLSFEDAKGAKSSLQLSVPVRTLTAAPPAAGEHKH